MPLRTILKLGVEMNVRITSLAIGSRAYAINKVANEKQGNKNGRIFIGPYGQSYMRILSLKTVTYSLHSNMVIQQPRFKGSVVSVFGECAVYARSSCSPWGLWFHNEFQVHTVRWINISKLANVCPMRAGILSSVFPCLMFFGVASRVTVSMYFENGWMFLRTTIHQYRYYVTGYVKNVIKISREHYTDIWRSRNKKWC